MAKPERKILPYLFVAVALVAASYSDHLGWEGKIALAKDILVVLLLGALLESRLEPFRRLADNLPEVLWLLDLKKGRAVYISPAYESIWGRPRASLYRGWKGFLDLVHPHDRPRLEAEVNRCVQDGSTCDEEYRIVRDDGSVR